MGNLYDNICSYENIKWSFDFLEKRNKRHGPDGVKWDDLHKIETSYLNKLVQELESKTFIPNPKVIKQTYYPGGDKILYYEEMNIREKIVEYAIKRYLYPLLEELFVDFSCAYRKNKGKKHVKVLMQKYIALKKNWFISLDIKSFFSSINQHKLVEYLIYELKDYDVVELINNCLRLKEVSGLPVGHVLSPLLSNFYLYRLDMKLYEEGISVIRYADNYCFAADNKSELMYYEKFLVELLSQYNLVINKSKTKVVCNPNDYTELII